MHPWLQHRPRALLIALTAVIAAVTDCNCEEEGLAVASGKIALALCDRGQACGCRDIDTERRNVDFATPKAGNVSRRTLTIRNDNPAKPLVVRRLALSDNADGRFSITAVRKRSNAGPDAEVNDHDMNSKPLRLVGEEVGEVALAFRPDPEADDPASNATLTVHSESGVHSEWELALRGGQAAAQVCKASAPSECGDGTVLDFGTLQDTDVTSSTQVERVLTITNSGDTEVFADVQLTRDGIPPRTPNDLPGEFGVFSLGELGCLAVGPGETLEIPVHYEPGPTGGEHTGEVVVNTSGQPQAVTLEGRVIGPRLCIETEDAEPDDTTLQFGDPPEFETPLATPEGDPGEETRSVWLRNCGFQANLKLGRPEWDETSVQHFYPDPFGDLEGLELEPGAQQVIDVTYEPASSVGSRAEAIMRLPTNTRLGQASLTFRGKVGPEPRCRLQAPVALEFGWVADDEDNANTGGVDCPPQFPFCPDLNANENLISRTASFQFSNAGDAACHDVTIEDIEDDNPDDSAFFRLADPDSWMQQPFDLAPGTSTDPIEVRFVAEYTEQRVNYFATLHYTSASWEQDITRSIDLKAQGGGSPTCEVEFEPVVPPSLLFCPEESLSFGNVNIGREKTVALQVKNIGSENCEVRNIRRSSTTSGNFTFSTTSLDIPVNGEKVVEVTYAAEPPSGTPLDQLAPLACESNKMLMDINSGPQGNEETHELALAANPVRPDIDVIPGEVDFGEVTVGCCSDEQEVTIYNSGDGALDISELGVVSEDADAENAENADSPFTITQMPEDMTVEPDESKTFKVQFCPAEQGLSSDIIRIAGSDDNEESFTVPLSGDGVLDDTGNDDFQQPPRPQVDVLWVVDDSGSMQEEQDQLADNFDNFIDTAVDLETDYHLGVITTDAESEEAGKLYACDGNPKFITSDQPDSEQQEQFGCNVRTSQSNRPSSDAKESALQAARLALDYPHIDEYNAGFYRDAATLYIIMVTDEKDQSDGSADLYVDYFRNLKGIANSNLLNISAISGPPPEGCETANSNQKGYDAVQAVGGQFRSICSADWSGLVSSLGLDVFNARRQFPLSRPAIESELEVEVCEDDGNGSPETDTCETVTDGWSFDAELNSVVFEDEEAPGPSQHVQFDYSAVCFDAASEQ